MYSTSLLWPVPEAGKTGNRKVTEKATLLWKQCTACHMLFNVLRSTSVCIPQNAPDQSRVLNLCLFFDHGSHSELQRSGTTGTELLLEKIGKYYY